jgi:hypothetical protein
MMVPLPVSTHNVDHDEIGVGCEVGDWIRGRGGKSPCPLDRFLTEIRVRRAFVVDKLESQSSLLD